MRYMVDLYLHVAATVHGVDANSEDDAIESARRLIYRHEADFTDRDIHLDGHRVTTSQSDDDLLEPGGDATPDDESDRAELLERLGREIESGADHFEHRDRTVEVRDTATGWLYVLDGIEFNNLESVLDAIEASAP